MPEQRAVGTGSSAAPSQGGGHREVVHAQRWGLSSGLLCLWQQAWRTVAWSLLLVHLPWRQLNKKTQKDRHTDTNNSLVKSDRNIIELLYRAWVNYWLETTCSPLSFLIQLAKLSQQIKKKFATVFRVISIKSFTPLDLNYAYFNTTFFCFFSIGTQAHIFYIAHDMFYSPMR